MSGLPDILVLLLALPVMAMLFLVHAGPQLLAGWAEHRSDEAKRRAAQQAELDRKLAIAEAAAAARARGEAYVPPSDYDRAVW